MRRRRRLTAAGGGGCRAGQGPGLAGRWGRRLEGGDPAAAQARQAAAGAAGLPAGAVAAWPAPVPPGLAPTFAAGEYADVVRRSGIYGPRDYQKIVEQLISSWNIEFLTQLNEIGRKAQDKIMSIPERLQKVAEFIESRINAKSFRFDVIFDRVLNMA